MSKYTRGQLFDLISELDYSEIYDLYSRLCANEKLDELQSDSLPADKSSLSLYLIDVCDKHNCRDGLCQTFDQIEKENKYSKVGFVFAFAWRALWSWRLAEGVFRFSGSATKRRITQAGGRLIVRLCLMPIIVLATAIYLLQQQGVIQASPYITILGFSTDTNFALISVCLLLPLYYIFLDWLVPFISLGQFNVQMGLSFGRLTTVVFSSIALTILPAILSYLSIRGVAVVFDAILGWSNGTKGLWLVGILVVIATIVALARNPKDAMLASVLYGPIIATIALVGVLCVITHNVSDRSGWCFFIAWIATMSTLLALRIVIAVFPESQPRDESTSRVLTVSMGLILTLLILNVGLLGSFTPVVFPGNQFLGGIIAFGEAVFAIEFVSLILHRRRFRRTFIGRIWSATSNTINYYLTMILAASVIIVLFAAAIAIGFGADFIIAFLSTGAFALLVFLYEQFFWKRRPRRASRITRRLD